MAKPGKKRKRGQSLDMLPESQQFFKGLSFCKNRNLDYYVCSSNGKTQIFSPTMILHNHELFVSEEPWNGVQYGSKIGEMELLM